MMRAVFALLALGFPAVVLAKIAAQRRTIGRSPVVLGRTGGWQGWFERVAPLGLFYWPAAWLWIAAGTVPLATGLRGAIGLLLLVIGGGLSASSVFLMGRAWRIGIDPENRTDLADSGPYRRIRHPIYGGWLLMLLGSVLVVPHPAIAIGAVVTALGVALQARREERHMVDTFGDRYVRYAAHTGRFLPRLRGR
jgi:protein-S-isoprenylcysteine O-methyltransferase Ste14